MGFVFDLFFCFVSVYISVKHSVSVFSFAMHDVSTVYSCVLYTMERKVKLYL